MNYNRELIYLASLLHDIGKFYQRADKNNSRDSKILTAETKNLENTLCPTFRGEKSHKHVLWTAQFIKDQENKFSKLISDVEGLNLDSLIRLASVHHNPDPNNLMECVIQKADHYSNGANRTKIDELWKDNEENDRFRKTKLRSVFEGIHLSKQPEIPWNAKYNAELPLSSLSISFDYFPKDNDNRLVDYDKLWKDFNEEFQLIKTDTIKSFTETLLFLLEKYATRIPSNISYIPDVSLYDHLKITSAFAICLYDYISENKLNTIPAKENKPFLLIGGDLFGIQKFVYGIITHGATKNLKGRSFYIQLLIDNIVNLIIDELNLTQANIIYYTGGGFYLLAPNTETVKEKIKGIHQKLSDKLLEYHNTELYLSLASEEFGESNIYYDKSLTNNIDTIWKNVYEKLNIDKAKQFKDQIKKNYNYFFTASEMGGIKEKDAITNEEIQGNAEIMDEYKVNCFTLEQIKLGEKLIDSDYWIILNKELIHFKDKGFNPIGIGKYNYFLNSGEIKINVIAEDAQVISINNLNFISDSIEGKNNVFGFVFYGGNTYPLSRFNDPKTLEELCGVVFEDNKRKNRYSQPWLVQMGVLRMDIDNFENVFKRGLSTDKRLFSRYSTLSWNIDYFFKGYLNEIWNEEGKTDSERLNYSKYSQIIYSGGDDLFIVGKWDILIELAKEINIKFREWTCYNPDLTLSGGITFVDPGIPIQKAALMCEEEIIKAKEHKYAAIEKNAISLFGYAFNWEKEFKYVLNLKNTIKYLLNKEKGLSRGFPTTIYKIMEQAKLIYKDGQYNLVKYDVVWHSAYNFKSTMQKSKDEEIKEFFAKWLNHIYTGKIPELQDTKYHALQILAISARWADLENR